MCRETQREQAAPVAVLAKEDEWIEKLDLEGFGREMRALGAEMRAQQGEADVAHLNKVLSWNWMLTVAGVATLGLSPNPFTVLCLSTAWFFRWTMIGHHVCHGGYENTTAKQSGYSKFVFAVGSLFRRAVDWFDWMLPEAWNLEHGRLHHYSLNESEDPDLVQRNTRWLQGAPLPLPLKWVVVAFFAFTWKWTYYSSNTYSELLLNKELRKVEMSEQVDGLKDAAEKRRAELRKEKAKYTAVTLFTCFGSAPSWWSSTGWLRDVMMPLVIYRFVVLPMPFLLVFGKQAMFNAIINLLLAELLTNAHSFLAIVTNHCGSDLYYFDTHCKPLSDEFYLRQVIGSADFAVGNDAVDCFHGWLNYQVEHHAWPDLSMLSYQRVHLRCKAICLKYKVPFVQHSVFYRLWKTVQVFTGVERMRLFPQRVLDAAQQTN